MPRQARKESGTGIYHVMLRGINRQDIFEDAEDYMRMLRCMQQMLEQYDDQGNRLPPLCTFYAYCLMSNHVHLLLRVNQKGIGSTIKHLAVMYAMYYNQKYSRSGHVFQDRFKSEPVNDMAYFVTLLRYIHQNPVKAGIVNKVNDYEFSSWHEYEDKNSTLFPLCDTHTVLNRVSFDELNEQAKASPRLRMNMDLRNSDQDQSHRMLNAVEPGTEVPIHRHPTKDESFVILRGKVRVTTHNDDGSVIEDVVLSQESGNYGVDIPKNVWHKLESLESGSVIFECKEGPFVEHEVEGILEVKSEK